MTYQTILWLISIGCIFSIWHFGKLAIKDVLTIYHGQCGSIIGINDLALKS